MIDWINAALLVIVLLVSVKSNRLQKRIMHIMSSVPSSLADLTAEVAEEKTVMQGAVVAINGLSARLQAVIDLAGDPDAVIAGLEQLKSDLDTSGNALAAAVATVPPAEPPVA